jgi:hypothetical protein
MQTLTDTDCYKNEAIGLHCGQVHRKEEHEAHSLHLWILKQASEN